jgi:hypothetical protein
VDDVAIDNPQMDELVSLDQFHVSNWVFTLMAVSPNIHENERTYLLDSGASHHMSPYRDAFVNFRSFELTALTAANQQFFYATGVGHYNPPAQWLEHLPNLS